MKDVVDGVVHVDDEIVEWLTPGETAGIFAQAIRYFRRTTRSAIGIADRIAICFG
jgi:hypothetical protein